jgi:hypothetical protein
MTTISSENVPWVYGIHCTLNKLVSLYQELIYGVFYYKTKTDGKLFATS